MKKRCFLCGTTDPTAFHTERSRCIPCRRTYDASRLNRPNGRVTRQNGHTIGDQWYGFVHLCPGERTCPVLDFLTRQFIREQQPRQRTA
jgi:hypothetical protein